MHLFLNYCKDTHLVWLHLFCTLQSFSWPHRGIWICTITDLLQFVACSVSNLWKLWCTLWLLVPLHTANCPWSTFWLSRVCNGLVFILVVWLDSDLLCQWCDVRTDTSHLQHPARLRAGPNALHFIYRINHVDFRQSSSQSSLICSWQAGLCERNCQYCVTVASNTWMLYQWHHFVVRIT